MSDIRVSTSRGWEIVHLGSDELDVDVVPGKGGDVTSVRWRPLGVDVMWHTRWGLRVRGESVTAGSSETLLMHAYPGGWQTVFPNGGDAAVEHGVEWGMHGEAWLAAYDWRADGPGAVELSTQLVRSPFSVVKRITVTGPTVTVAETATNEAAEPIEVMWSQHPAFGAPLIGPGARVETSARTVHRDPSAHAAWPALPGAGPDDGADLSRLPEPRSGVSRLAYLGDFAEGRAGIVNDELGLRADLTWDASLMPYAWYWLEAGGRTGFPFYSDAYVLALEPATSWPGRGIATVRRTTGTQITIDPGQSRTSSVSLTLAVP
ncbi:aldose 1-epimerase [Jiangella asiatica]|uniref:aldose 1-epimerase n=1 Tax=Jiangella asiatica TaxID=2530372 RepID=UPI0013A5CC23|nr:aldose 1-epimerase [Jiangella asiatica]